MRGVGSLDGVTITAAAPSSSAIWLSPRVASVPGWLVPTQIGISPAAANVLAAARVHDCETLADAALEDGAFEAREARFVDRPED